MGLMDLKAAHPGLAQKITGKMVTAAEAKRAKTVVEKKAGNKAALFGGKPAVGGKVAAAANARRDASKNRKRRPDGKFGQ